MLDTIQGLAGKAGDEPDFTRGSEWHFKPAHGQYVEPAVAKVLRMPAGKGGVTCIQMDDDKRWRWCCREVAARNDRSVHKENRRGSRQRRALQVILFQLKKYCSVSKGIDYLKLYYYLYSSCD
jgi:hypothetical protein